MVLELAPFPPLPSPDLPRSSPSTITSSPPSLKSKPYKWTPEPLTLNQNPQIQHQSPAHRRQQLPPTANVLPPHPQPHQNPSRKPSFSPSPISGTPNHSNLNPCFAPSYPFNSTGYNFRSKTPSSTGPPLPFLFPSNCSAKCPNETLPLGLSSSPASSNTIASPPQPSPSSTFSFTPTPSDSPSFVGYSSKSYNQPRVRPNSSSAPPPITHPHRSKEWVDQYLKSLQEKAMRQPPPPYYIEYCQEKARRYPTPLQYNEYLQEKAMNSSIPPDVRGKSWEKSIEEEENRELQLNMDVNMSETLHVVEIVEVSIHVNDDLELSNIDGKEHEILPSSTCDDTGMNSNSDNSSEEEDREVERKSHVDLRSDELSVENLREADELEKGIKDDERSANVEKNRSSREEACVVGVEGGFDNQEHGYEETYKIIILSEFVSLPFPPVELPDKARLAVNGILAAKGVECKEQLAVWTIDKKLGTITVDLEGAYVFSKIERQPGVRFEHIFAPQLVDASCSTFILVHSSLAMLTIALCGSEEHYSKYTSENGSETVGIVTDASLAPEMHTLEATPVCKALYFLGVMGNSTCSLLDKLCEDGIVRQWGEIIEDGTIVVIFDPGGGEDAATWADTGNGFGESDPHPGRNLNSSAVDMLQLADAVGFIDKFWDALGPYLKYSPDAISLVVNKLFEPLTSLPCSLMAMDYGAGHARLQICASFTRIARAADKSRLPRMKDLASVQMLKQIEQGTGSIPGFLSHDYIAVEIVEVSVPVNEDLELSNIYGKKHEHHCRSCGRTLCHDHSSNQMALPQFGLYSNVRVCDECFNNPSRSIRDDQTSSDAIRDRFSKVNVGEDVGSKDQATAGVSASNVTDCKCGMPLCICEAPVPEPIPSQVRNVSVSSVQASTISKKAVSTPQIVDSMPKKQASSSNSKPSPFFNLNQANNGSLNKAPSDYDISGEELREAIKGSDVDAVRKLLSEGVDANYCDKQGLTLLHLAALFNQTEIAFILMDHGAKVESKNAQGETPLDCAPTMLQNKMREKLEDDDKAIAQSDDQPMT